MKKIFLPILFLACRQNETTQQKAEDAVKKYVRQNAHDANSYKPLAFGKLDTVYTNDSSSYWELAVVRKNLVTQFNGAKNNGWQSLADSLRKELEIINHKMDSGKTISALKIFHLSQGKNESGEIVMNRGSFYFDTGFHVRDFILTEDSLLMTQ